MTVQSLLSVIFTVIVPAILQLDVQHASLSSDRHHHHSPLYSCLYSMCTVRSIKPYSSLVVKW